MKKLIQLNISFVLIFLTFHSSFAEVKYGVPEHYTWTDPIFALSSNAVPLTRIRKGLKELTLTGAYITVKEDDEESINDTTDFSDNVIYESTGEADGYGISFSWFEALGKNWGYSVIASYTPLDGKTVALYETDNNNFVTSKHKADIEASSFQALGFVVYDPLNDRDNLNTPLFVGAGLYQASQKGSLEKTIGSDTYKWNAEIDFVSVGFVLGGALQFNTGDFRWSPFMMGFFGTSTPSYELTVQKNNTNVFTNSAEPEFEVQWLGGLAFKYMPWELGGRWTPNFFGHNQDIFTLSKTWTW
ncbi:MAG: hypothetical protein OEY33_07280 [Bdellovibrionales bacterium]|nr:hypothetical protein [Bdellovibrionales bacterium]